MFGEDIREKRIEKGLTQAQLARKVKVHPSQISRWEGNETYPREDNEKRLVTALFSSVKKKSRR